MILKLSDVQVGKPTIPKDWDNKLQQYIEVDPHERFIDMVKGECQHRGDFRHLTHEQNKALYESITLDSSTVDPEDRYYHLNYLNYLEKCWGNHLGIVITPDIIWYTILSEVAIIIKASPESYRHLFTTSPDRVEIRVLASGSVMPVDLLVEKLKGHVPTDTSLFFPKLEYTKNSMLAFYTAFSEICSPYYDYCMLLCGFPYIDVQGRYEDWQLIKDHWDRLKVLIKNDKWVTSVSSILSTVLENFNSVDLWKNIFSIKKCGSGHQTTVSGWFSEFFVEEPRLKYVSNFSTHISNFKYKNLTTEKSYEMNTGLFSSTQKGDFMEPSFSSVVFDLTDYHKAVSK